VDTSGLVALLNQDDSLHSLARIRWQELGQTARKVVLTDWILAETGNGLARTGARAAFVETARRFLNSADGRLVDVTLEIMEKALGLYLQRPDKSWGLVDCASFVLMSKEGIFEAFTTDRHFEQAGFTCLLPTSAS
jgi:hypothetical protein